MAEHRSSDHPRHVDSGLTADEVEQRQRLDGSFEESETVRRDTTEPLPPDVLEQRQRIDGTVDQGGRFDEPSDEPLSPDQLEQRERLEDDDEEPWPDDDED